MEKSWHLFERNKERFYRINLPGPPGPEGEGKADWGRFARIAISDERASRQTETIGNLLDLYPVVSYPRKIIKGFSNESAVPILLYPRTP